MKATIRPGARIPEWESQLQALGFEVRCYEQSGSTMDLARDILPLVTPQRPGLVISKRQIGGRGRQGRDWVPPSEGFYATYAFSMEKTPEALAGLSLVVGVQLAELVSAMGAELTIKWPNDSLSLAGDKLAGILIETSSVGGVTNILIGVGVNLEGEPKDISGATSVRTLTGEIVGSLDFGLRFSSILKQGWKEFNSFGFSRFKDRFMAKATYLNREITLDHGGVVERGIMRGVDSTGALLVEIDGAVMVRSSGEVKNLRPVVL